MSDFTGKTVVITGAGKGIGRACVELLTHRGARVVALSRSQTDLDDLAAKFGATVVSVDLADNAAARAAIKRAGLADALINCAPGDQPAGRADLRAGVRAGSHFKWRRRFDRECDLDRRTSWFRGSRGLCGFEGRTRRRDTRYG